MHAELDIFLLRFPCVAYMFIPPSNAGIGSKWMLYLLSLFDHLIKRYDSFLVFQSHCTAITKFQINPSAGALNARGWGKFAIFDRNRRLSWKRYEIGPQLSSNITIVNLIATNFPTNVSALTENSNNMHMLYCRCIHLVIAWVSSSTHVIFTFVHQMAALLQQLEPLLEYPRDAVHSTVFAVVRYLSVGLSAVIVSKRLNLSLNFLSIW